MRLLLLIPAVAATLPVSLALAALVGLGAIRDLSPLQCALSACLLLGFGVAGLWTLLGRGPVGLVAALWLWPGAVLLGLPGYFPGDLAEGLHTGVRVVVGPFDNELARRWATQAAELVPESQGRSPLIAAETVVATVPCVNREALADDQVALPYEGNGRTLSVPIHVGEVELPMLFDTGATLTTLSSAALRRVGVEIPADAPEVTLRTANGERSARLVLVPELWLGGFPIQGVTVGVCEECADQKVNGLLGLNVSGQFMVTLDTAAHELLFTARPAPDRTIDVQPWLDVRATTTHYGDGRIEALAEIENRAFIPVSLAEVGLSCGPHHLKVPIEKIPARGSGRSQRMLGRDLDCDAWKVTLDRASW